MHLKPFHNETGPLPAYESILTRVVAISGGEILCLFSNNGWPIEEGVDKSEFERYCHTLSRLDPNLQDLMIGLSGNLEHIIVKDYLTLLLEPLNMLRQDAGNNNLIFATCTPMKEVGSVRFGSVCGVFKGMGYNERVSVMLTKLCMFKGSLPRGAPTSPMLSNLMFAELDRIIFRYCRERNII